MSVADTSIPNDELASSVDKASNSSSGATITVTMSAGGDELLSQRV